MKKVIFTFIAILIAASAVYSQSGWFRVSDSIPNLWIYSIKFTSQNTGYAAGSYNGTGPGAILKTTNSGNNWVITQMPNSSCDDLHFFNDNTGFFVGGLTYSYVYKTTNGGLNWTIKDTTYSIFNIRFFDNNTGYISAKWGAIKKTTNGGENWFSITNGGWYEPGDMALINNNTCLVSLSSDNKISMTTNGGVNWNINTFLGAGPFYKFSFINSSTGFCSSYSGFNISKTTNSSQNWVNICNINSPIYMYGDLKFIDALTGYSCCNNGNVYKTTNGGYNWFAQKTPSNTDMLGSFFLNANTGFVGDQNGMIYKTTNGGAVFIANISNEVSSSYSLEQNYPNPFNPATNIKFDIPKSNIVKLIVYDIRGKEIKTLVNEKLSPCTYELNFDGSTLPSGIYFYRLQSGDYIQTKKMILIK